MNAEIKPGKDSVEVVIAGLGPTGLVLAHLLGRCGRRVLVLEREPRFYGNARAVYTDDECMRIFQSIGMAKELQARMLVETPVQFVRPDGTPMGRYVPRRHPLGWPIINFFYQPYLETSLTEGLARYPNVEIRRGRELIDFAQDDRGVTVTHQATQSFRFREDSDARAERGGDADVQAARCRYLIGADGGRSAVRAKLGIEMTGRNFPEPWLVVDLKAKEGEEALRHMPYFNFVVDPDMPAVSCVQPDGYHRFEFMLMKGHTKEYMERPETVRQLLSKFVDPDKFEVRRKLVYTFNALVANKWRDRRVLLAGDAAHMTPQFLGQGASSGIRDACNLGWKLDLVLSGKAADELLDSYERERRDHAKAMVDVSVLLKNAVSMTHPVKTALRDLALKLALAVPPLRQWFEDGGFKPKPVYTKGRYLGLPRRRRRGPEGSLAPQPLVRSLDGRRLLLDELLGDGFSLLGLRIDPRTCLTGASMSFLEDLDSRFVTLFPYGGRPQGLHGVERSTARGVSEVEDMGGEMVHWFAKAGFVSDAVAILRPDKFAFALVPAGQLEQAVAELRSQLGWTPRTAQLSEAA